MRNFLTEAVIFAAKAHKNQKRKGTEVPYIVHPLEAFAICLTLTDDADILAAALLHDTIEDSGVTKEQLTEKFGGRVSELVAKVSEQKFDKEKEIPWKARKQSAIDKLTACTDTGVKAVALSDKLANLRALDRDKKLLGEQLWQRFRVKDPAEHYWYYKSLFDALSDFEGTEAYEEYRKLLEKVF